MKFKNIIGRIEEDSSYFGFEIEGGENKNSIGDQVWFEPGGNYLEIYELLDDDVLEELIDMFEISSKKPFRGALRRVGILRD